MAEDRTYFDMTAEEVYGTFLSALAGLEDDAGIEGFSREGVEHLRAALQARAGDGRAVDRGSTMERLSRRADLYH